MGRHRGSAPTLRVARVEDIPLREVSGVCLRRGADRAMALVAIGDRAATAAWTELPADDRVPITWEVDDLTGIAGMDLPARDPQIEAVCADGAGRVLLLQESPPRSLLVDPAARRVIASIDLRVPPGHPFAHAWVDPDGSQGEGAVFLANGHLLVAKEKDPAAFIEFGPAGEPASGFVTGAALADGDAWPVAEGAQAFIPLATWMPDAALEETCEDFSDLEVGPDGRLYVLSDKSASLARLDPLPAEGGRASAQISWRLAKVDGKPEGLAFTRNGRAIVALDTRKAKANILFMEPPVAAPDTTVPARARADRTGHGGRG